MNKIKPEKLTKEEAIEWVKEIYRISGDPEEAHSKEDWLYEWFIACVFGDMYTISEAKDIAKVVLHTKEIDFPRWCA